MRPATPAFGPPAASPNLFQARSSPMMMLLVYLLVFNHFGRPFEYMLVGLKIPAIICGIGILAVAAAGYWKMFFTQVGRPLFFFVIWMFMATLFSTWRGGSADFLKIYVQFWVIFFLMTAGAPKSFKDISRLATVIGLSCIFDVILGADISKEGRFQLKGTTYGNSDDVALLAGFAIPFIIFGAMHLKNRVLGYALMIAGVSYMLLTTLRTATRAAIPALLVMVAVYFFRGKGAQKVAIVALCCAGLIGATFLLSASTLARLATLGNFFGLSDVEHRSQSGVQISEADGSMLERKKLVQDAIEMTFHHPLLGVGPGEFVDYRTRMLEGSGDQSHILPSHNTYLQVASEMGVVGLGIYLFFLASIYGGIRRIRKLNQSWSHTDSQAISRLTLAIEAAFAYFVICAAFMTCDHHPQQFVMAGLVIALERILVMAAGTSVVQNHLNIVQGIGMPGVAPSRIRAGKIAASKSGPGKTSLAPGF